MIYLVPNADCVCFNNNLRLFKGVKYAVPDLQNLVLMFLANDCYPLTLNLYDICRKFVNGRFLSLNCQKNNIAKQHYTNSDYNYSNNDINNTKIEYKKSDIQTTINNPKNNYSNRGSCYTNSDYNNNNNDNLFNVQDDGAVEIYKNVCCCGSDLFVFLNFKPICNAAFHTIKLKNSEISISLSKMLTISIGGDTLVEMPNCNLTYSHYETFNNFCFIYFLGVRNFVVVFKGNELFYANYYDKIEFLNDEYYFLTYLKDSLNHGKVCHVTDKESENYLVYLDDFDLNLKPQFLPHVFLDCLLAGNFKYCNALLCGELKQNEPSQIANFFCEFDLFYPLNNLTFALIKKDAVAGIYKFEIENDKIANICEI